VPALARGERGYVGLLVRGRIVSWAAVGLVLVTGLENLRGAGLTPWLVAKLGLVIALLSLAAHRDFALVPRAAREIERGVAPGLALAALRWLDRGLIVLAAAVLFLAVGVARGR
jgi:hypothetical protein